MGPSRYRRSAPSTSTHGTLRASKGRGANTGEPRPRLGRRGSDPRVPDRRLPTHRRGGGARRREPGDGIDSLPAWVTRVALNLSKSRLRRVRAESRARERAEARWHVDEPQDSRLDVELAMAKLPRRQRQATVLRYYLGYDVADTARVLGVSEGTIKTTLHRARHTMAAALGEEE